ncbi:MAG: Calx-beta domain-containing protein [Micromonosporaceae bacterium]
MASSLVRRAAKLSIGTLVLAASAIAPAAAAYAAPGVAAPIVSISDIAVSEGDSGTANASFTVTLSKANGKINTVEYATVDGSATAGLDYQAKSGTVTFNKRETSKTIQVPIIGDTIDEPDETFTVVLSQPSKDLIIGDGTGQATISDDDLAPPTPTQADLAIQLTDSPDPIGLGAELTYTAHVVNHGPDAATDVVVVDQLKPYVTFVSASASCVHVSGKVTCSAATLASGAGYDPQVGDHVSP